MEYDHLDRTADLNLHGPDEEDLQRCPECGNPRREPATRGGTETAAERRPTEAECWKAFWTKLAIIWTSLPPDVQQEGIEEADGRAGTPQGRPWLTVVVTWARGAAGLRRRLLVGTEPTDLMFTDAGKPSNPRYLPIALELTRQVW